MEKTTALPVFDTTAPYNIKRGYYLSLIHI